MGAGAIVVSVPGRRRARAPRRRAESLVEQLARGTAPLHDHLEGRLDLPGGLRDAAHYRALLAAMVGAWEPVERTLAASGAGEALGLAPLARSAALRQDLDALGGAPAQDRPVRGMGLAEGVGTIYVLEGSAAGGPVLAPLIERHLHLEPGVATRFFRGLGPDTGRRWSEVHRAVDRWGRACGGREIDRAVWGAQLTFAIVGGAMAAALAGAAGGER